MSKIISLINNKILLFYPKSKGSQKNFTKSLHVLFIISTILFLYSCTDPYSQGKRIYTTLCSNCHGDDGNGLKKLIPSIVDSKILSDPQKLICTIRNGINADSLDTKLSVMPSHKKMTEVEMTNLVNFLNQEFRKDKVYFNLKDIGLMVKKCN